MRNVTTFWGNFGNLSLFLGYIFVVKSFSGEILKFQEKAGGFGFTIGLLWYDWWNFIDKEQKTGPSAVDHSWIFKVLGKNQEAKVI